jgi:GxxExxY protein
MHGNRNRYIHRLHGEKFIHRFSQINTDADLFCFNKIIVEIKALSELTSVNETQLLNYLKILNLKVGLLINFGKENLEYNRFIF